MRSREFAITDCIAGLEGRTAFGYLQLARAAQCGWNHNHPSDVAAARELADLERASRHVSAGRTVRVCAGCGWAGYSVGRCPGCGRRM